MATHRDPETSSSSGELSQMAQQGQETPRPLQQIMFKDLSDLQGALCLGEDLSYTRRKKSRISKNPKSPNPAQAPSNEQAERLRS
eukprot:CAMPEP_0180700790 /NCGR_PEP_ID=MMETSP1038_2-20121128/5261_1 /TAXON_ID=632150 /ORGANISM="Azadinium spinosum, Strain 3D9" /LENGTH=84 /DNA_ID=CAMNT_0022732481 /DNA_START=347 /DNA_END=601 /DNA_ORIENTATION=-